MLRKLANCCHRVYGDVRAYASRRIVIKYVIVATAISCLPQAVYGGGARERDGGMARAEREIQCDQYVVYSRANERV